MSAPKPQQDIVSSAQTGFLNPLSYEEYLKSPAGKSDMANMKLVILEEIYVKEQAARLSQQFIDEVYGSETETETETKTTEQITDLSVDAKNKETDKSYNDDELQECDDLLEECANSRSQTIGQLSQSRLTTEYLDTNTKARTSSAANIFETSFKKKNHAYDDSYVPYNITAEKYTAVMEYFEKAEREQRQKLLVLNEEEKKAFACDERVEKLKTKLIMQEEKWNSLPPPLKTGGPGIAIKKRITALYKEIDKQEALAQAIRASVNERRAKTHDTLNKIAQAKEAWDMAASQSGRNFAPGEHIRRVRQRSAMLGELKKTPVFEKKLIDDAMETLGIDRNQWDSLPDEQVLDPELRTGPLNDKVDLIEDAFVAKTGLYTDTSIPGNREKQNKLNQAYRTLYALLPVGTQTITPPPVRPPSPTSTLSEEAREARLENLDPKASAVPVSPLGKSAPSPASGRQMNEEERRAVSQTIDKEASSVREKFYDGGIAEQRSVVAKQYQAAFQANEEAKATLAALREKPQKSSQVANEEDLEYYTSLQQEREKDLQNYSTLANYYGIPTSQTPPVTPTVTPNSQNAGSAPERNDHRDARLKRLGQPQTNVETESNTATSNPMTNAATPQTQNKLSEKQKENIRNRRDAHLKTLQASPPEPNNTPTAPIPTPRPGKTKSLSEKEKEKEKEKMVTARVKTLQASPPEPNNTPTTPIPTPRPGKTKSLSEKEKEKEKEKMVAARLDKLAQKEVNMSVVAVESFNATNTEQLQGNLSSIVPGSQVNKKNNGYSAQGPGFSLMVQESPESGKIEAKLLYDKKTVSPDQASNILATACPRPQRGSPLKGVVKLTGDNKELQQITTKNLSEKIDPRHIITQEPETAIKPKTEVPKTDVSEQSNYNDGLNYGNGPNKN